VRPVLIAGPTASGKSALALAIAERDGGVVINADALQVYACWRALTARPGDADLARAPHRLFGHVPCDAAFSVGAWLRALVPVLAEARERGWRPILVGGTGLYFEALTEGLAVVPAIPQAVRAEAAARLARGGLAALLADLARDDRETLAGVDARNPARVRRAWEVLAATGRGLAAWRQAPRTPILPAEAAVRVLADVNKDHLNRVIKMRFDQMLEEGALEECARFIASGYDLSAPAGRALGAAELAAHLAGGLTLDAARDAAVTATRRYAKRQRTWFRNRMAEWPRLDPTDPGALARISLR
jgi:tRNA dimethylallyltransferase